MNINYVVVSATRSLSLFFSTLPLPRASLKILSLDLASTSPCTRNEITILINRLWGFSEISISPFDMLEAWATVEAESQAGGTSRPLECRCHFITLWREHRKEKVHPSSTFLLNSEHILMKLFIFFRSTSPAALFSLAHRRHHAPAWIKIISKYSKLDCGWEGETWGTIYLR